MSDYIWLSRLIEIMFMQTKALIYQVLLSLLSSPLTGCIVKPLVLIQNNIENNKMGTSKWRLILACRLVPPQHKRLLISFNVRILLLHDFM